MIPELWLGVKSILLAYKLIGINNIFNDIDKKIYTTALGSYFRIRLLEPTTSKEEAWNELITMIETTIPGSANEQEKNLILSETKLYFEELFKSYKDSDKKL